jgi:hypothetical protein
MARDRTYELRDNSDGLPRAAVGVFLRLTQNQVASLEQLAGTKPLAVFLRDIAEAAIEQLVPARAE